MCECEHVSMFVCLFVICHAQLLGEDGRTRVDLGEVDRRAHS